MHASVSAGNALFLDIDGTLLDIAEKPELVVVPAGLPDLLDRLRERLDGALALLSGRPIDQIDRFFPAKLPVAAEHGAILRDASGKLQQLVARPAAFDDWYASLKRETKGMLGVTIEVKNVSLVIHYRQAPQSEAALRELAMRLIAQAGPEVALLPAHMAFELRPEGFGKDAALRRFMQGPPFAGRLPVFVGDDVTDEPAIAAANELGGRGLHVTRDFAGGPAAVRSWLGES